MKTLSLRHYCVMCPLECVPHGNTPFGRIPSIYGHSAFSFLEGEQACTKQRNEWVTPFRLPWNTEMRYKHCVIRFVWRYWPNICYITVIANSLWLQMIDIRIVAATKSLRFSLFINRRKHDCGSVVHRWLMMKYEERDSYLNSCAIRYQEYLPFLSLPPFVSDI